MIREDNGIIEASKLWPQGQDIQMEKTMQWRLLGESRRGRAAPTAQAPRLPCSVSALDVRMLLPDVKSSRMHEESSVAQLSLCVTRTSARHQQHTSRLVSHRHALVPGNVHERNCIPGLSRSMAATTWEASNYRNVLFTVLEAEQLHSDTYGDPPATSGSCWLHMHYSSPWLAAVSLHAGLHRHMACPCVSQPSSCKDTSHADQGLTWVKYHFILNDSYIGNDPVFQTRSRPEVLGLGCSMCLLSEGDTVHP